MVGGMSMRFIGVRKSLFLMFIKSVMQTIALGLEFVGLPSVILSGREDPSSRQSKITQRLISARPIRTWLIDN